MKSIIKTIAITAITAFTLAGCAENKEINESIGNVIEDSSASTASEVEKTTTSTVDSKPVESSAASDFEKPAESSSTTTTTTSTASEPVEKPVESKPTSSTASKPVVKPTTSSTSTTTVYKPVEKPAHNCKTDGHVWKELTPKTSTETVEIKETHNVCANGYDYTLAHKYFGRKMEDIDFTPYFGTTAYGSGSTKVKTTGTKTITEYIHKCTECGSEEVYNTEKTVTPGDTWEFVYSNGEFFNTIWYDINNIPDEVYEAVEKDNKASEDFWDTF